MLTSVGVAFSPVNLRKMFILNRYSPFFFFENKKDVYISVDVSIMDLF